MAERKNYSVEAVEKMKTILIDRLNFLFGKTFANYDRQKLIDHSDEYKELIAAKEEIIIKISKEIEEYAVKTFKKYGVTSVPVCHRSDPSGVDRLRIDLKVKTFPGTEDLQKAFDKAEADYRNDLRAIDLWVFDALKKVASREELPKVPESSRKE